MSYVANFEAMMSGFQIFEDVHAPVPTLRRLPVKGPYFQRRLKRMKRDPKNWTAPQYFLTGNTIIAHPSVIALLIQKLRYPSGTAKA